MSQARTRRLNGPHAFAVAALGVVAVLAAGPTRAAAETSLPDGFQQSTVFSGLELPTAVEFAPDGRVFVAEKSGLIRVFSGPSDDSGEIAADLRTQVHNFWDRGLLDIALDPDFTNQPYLYAIYTHDAELGGTAPRWGSAGVSADPCPSPPGPTADGCVVSGRISRLLLDGNTAGPEQVLVEDWCQQYPSHSVGSLAFDDSGALYASGGDGASFIALDWGQHGSPPNPCDDPPDGVGTAMEPPDAAGGALRSQDLQTPADPTGLDGTVIRIDRSDGSPLPDNPGSGDVNARRAIAYGFRNPFRIALRPGTDEIWLGDVGWNDYEEVNRIEPGPVRNYGWPCYEGTPTHIVYRDQSLALCANLYEGRGTVEAPHFEYAHDAPVTAGDTCFDGGSSVSGLAFYEGGPFPDSYDDALFFADYSRRCIYVMAADAGGDPDPAQVEPFGLDAEYPVNLKLGEDGALYYPDFDGGRVMAIRYFEENQPPTAVIAADKTFGPAPLTVQFDGAGSTDPDSSNALSYEWDLDGDGDLDDSTDAAPSHEYGSGGTRVVKLRVTDPDGASGTAELAIHVGNSPPQVSIDAPASGVRWSVGEEISFSGSAEDAEDGPLDGAAIDWTLDLHHCPTGCHKHVVEQFDGIDGSFVAPDHEYPSFLELTLTATDTGGLSASESIQLDPRTVEVEMRSDPAGARMTLNANAAAAPLSVEVIAGSANTISAIETTEFGGQTYEWTSWAHGGPRTQTVVAPQTDVAFEAVYRDATAPETEIDVGPPALGSSRRASFEFSSSEIGSRFECRLDSDPFRPCSSPARLDGVEDGEHSFDARAIDGAGNVDDSPARHRFTVDASPPDVVLAVRGRRRLDRPIRLGIGCDEACEVTAWGRIVTFGAGGSAQAARRRGWVIQLRRRGKAVEPSGRSRIRLRPKGRANRRRLRRAVRRGRTGRAEVRVRVSDGLGNRTSVGRRFRLR